MRREVSMPCLCARVYLFLLMFIWAGRRIKNVVIDDRKWCLSYKTNCGCETKKMYMLRIKIVSII